MHSALYRGTVRHRRKEPVGHALSYQIHMVYLDLDELPEVLAQHPAWSSTRPALAWFRRADHFGDPRQTLSHSVRALVAERTGVSLSGPIRLLTHLRYFGLVFNPVSFFYCFDEAGQELRAVVAEVSNTPWGERHLYVVGGSGAKIRERFPKAFHVSPFMPMDQTYDWAFTRPGSGLVVHMRNLQGGREMFDATLSLRREPLTRASMSRALFGHPPMTAKILLAIYGNAFRLWHKRVPFFEHPKRSVS